jgi:hypothetical protein
VSEKVNAVGPLKVLFARQVPDYRGNRQVVAAGFVHQAYDPANSAETVCGVTGQLKQGNTTLVGKTALFRRIDPVASVWVIVFPLPDAIVAGRAVTSFQVLMQDKVLPLDPHEVIDIQGSFKSAGRNYAVDVFYPDEGAHDPSEAEYFLALGNAFDNHIAVTATMNTTGHASLDTTDGIWCATFPPLATTQGGNPINYTLHVADNYSHPANRDFTFE